MTITRKATTFVSALAACALIAGCSSGGDEGGDQGGQGDGANGGAPAAAVDELALNTEDVQGVTLMPITAEQLKEQADKVGELVDQMEVQPEECREATNLQSATLSKSVENAAARGGAIVAEGDSPQGIVSLSVTPAGEPNEARQKITENCGEMTVTLNLPDVPPQTSTVRNEKLEIPAPEGVEDFLAIKQFTDAPEGQPAGAGGIVLTGKVRDIDINVTTQAALGDIDAGLETRTLDIFTAQAKKIQDAE